METSIGYERLYSSEGILMPNLNMAMKMLIYFNAKIKYSNENVNFKIVLKCVTFYLMLTSAYRGWVG